VLAVQNYDLIDNQIRRLDHALKRLESEVVQGNQEGATVEALPISADDAKANDVPIDPHEPVYCICRQVAHGGMVACDNQECGEWFHFRCVGITTKRPKASWLCPNCSAKQ